MVRDIQIGGGAPVAVQSMTKTETTDVEGTLRQIDEMVEAGCEIVRIAVPDDDAAAAMYEIRKRTEVPIVADIHFHYKLALKALDAGIDKLRINPGNIGHIDRVREVVRAAEVQKVPIRIGVNGGSLEKDLLKKYGSATPEAMVESGMRHIRILEDLGFGDIIISLKASDVNRMVAAYRLMAEKVDYPLHLGVTEAGTPFGGTIKSAIGLGLLLHEGIGDTIRVSLAADPVEEVRVGFDILKSLGLRHRGVNIIACPSCARQGFNVIETVAELEQRLAHISTPMSLSIIGCVVNGPGEALMTDLGFTGGGKGAGMVYVAGKPDHKQDNAGMVDHIVELVEAKAAELEAARKAALQAAE
jgi:(E)-4-hydroxy-3-methylbut-2-enyl-diphosphate synthase